MSVVTDIREYTDAMNIDPNVVLVYTYPFNRKSDYINIMDLEELTCGIEVNDKKCGKPSIIAMIRLGQTTPVCKVHYAVAAIGEMEESKVQFNTCQDCNEGLMLYRNVSYNENTKEIHVWYSCSTCNKFRSYKRDIVNNNNENQ